MFKESRRRAAASFIRSDIKRRHLISNVAPTELGLICDPVYEQVAPNNVSIALHRVFAQALNRHEGVS